MAIQQLKYPINQVNHWNFATSFVCLVTSFCDETILFMGINLGAGDVHWMREITTQFHIRQSGRVFWRHQNIV